MGIHVVGMTYDAASVLAAFHSGEALGYPLLRDVGAKHVSALGILNEAYPEGHPAHGIPHPGVIYVDAQGTIRAKYAIPGYRQRPPFAALLEHLASLVSKGTDSEG